jgi:hypothetical protein
VKLLDDGVGKQLGEEGNPAGLEKVLSWDGEKSEWEWAGINS